MAIHRLAICATFLAISMQVCQAQEIEITEFNRLTDQQQFIMNTDSFAPNDGSIVEGLGTICEENNPLCSFSGRILLEGTDLPSNPKVGVLPQGITTKQFDDWYNSIASTDVFAEQVEERKLTVCRRVCIPAGSNNCYRICTHHDSSKPFAMQ